MMDDSSERLRDHYERQRLSPGKLSDLMAERRRVIASEAESLKPRESGIRSWLVKSGFDLSFVPRRDLRLAHVMTSIMLVGVLGVFVHRSGSLDERSDRTMREVAMNHVARLEFEYQASSLSELDQSMTLLPFALAAPERLSDEATVLGSRYCSLAGSLAAHLKFRTGDDERTLSLFVTSSSDDLADLAGTNHDIAGVDVELWQEGGLFYAMATNPGQGDETEGSR